MWGGTASAPATPFGSIHMEPAALQGRVECMLHGEWRRRPRAIWLAVSACIEALEAQQAALAVQAALDVQAAWLQPGLPRPLIARTGPEDGAQAGAAAAHGRPQQNAESGPLPRPRTLGPTSFFVLTVCQLARCGRDRVWRCALAPCSRPRARAAAPAAHSLSRPATFALPSARLAPSSPLLRPPFPMPCRACVSCPHTHTPARSAREEPPRRC